ncbi:DNA mismatch repair protein Msh6 [Centruroides vittatus]|uniref:DNA mismatch repair protein Msh6 n=1 Tax=Centruroides vittatus TaxID=120091 RepID=UPI003510A5DD
MNKKNTLFNYFSKSPTINGKNSPKSSPRVGKTPSKGSADSTSKRKKANNVKECPYSLYSIVWAKLEGYPWWPSLVCNHPKRGIHHEFRRTCYVHVQFFDDPPSRAWIKIKDLKPFTGPEDIDNPKFKDPVWKKGLESATKASNMPAEERNQLVVCLDTSEESENEDLDKSADGVEHMDEDQKVFLENGHSDSEPARKRRRLISEFDDDSEDEEFKPEKGESDSESDSSGVDENEISDIELQSEEISPVKKEKPRNKKRTKSIAKSVPATPTSLNRSPVSSDTKAKLSMFASSDSPKNRNIENGGEKIWPHLKLDWLKSHQRKDIQGRSPSDPDYDPRTLFIPESYKKTLTPALKQWWEMKAHHFDTILFFKVGKFYELYHMDAVVAVNELGILYMRGEFAHAGFPEISYGRYSDMLIRKGYKVARVEQTETPQMMEERCKILSKPSKFDRVVTREICRITTKGTRTFGFQESDPGNICNAYLLALTEKECNAASSSSEYGICFIDTSIGKFHIGQFVDDRNCSRLRTLMAHYPPAQILSEKGMISQKTQQVLNSCANLALREVLKPSSEFWDSSKTLKFLNEGKYFVDDKGVTVWPEAVKIIIDKSDPLYQTANEKYELGCKALGACVWYLNECCIEEDILTLKNFEIYTPIDGDIPENKMLSVSRQHMVLDGVTLKNLEILSNSMGTTEGTLLETLDCCSTMFGKRLLYQWLCSPLYNPKIISDRLNAIEDLQKVQEIIPDVVKLLRKLPDLERLLNKIHTQGLRRRSDHPDSRAILFEAATYGKRKIADFLSVLEGFKTSIEIMQLFENHRNNFTSSILQQCVTLETEGGLFPQLKDRLLYFDNSFDHEKAKRDGKIIPSHGVDNEYDTAMEEIEETKSEFDSYLRIQKNVFNCKVTYFGSGRNRYQLEVPENATKYVTDEYDLQTQRKGFKRYWTPTIKSLLAKLISAEEHRDAALKDIMRRIFSAFDSGRKQWEAAVHCLCLLDVFISLTQYSISSQIPLCRPEFVIDEEPFLEIREGRHPVLLKYFTGDDFIPNDVCIGLSESKENEKNNQKLVLVTGPNMGGKSTLMRQVGLIVIMAQIGCYVPAEKCYLTPVDHIFTRLGASDRITSGESTFYVELSETASILQHASKNSLVLLDELGRGTSTYDGTGIAYAVVHQLASSVQCCTLFSTHYHCLVDEFIDHPNVKLGHMACMVENENEDPTQETITFLYKFVSGACPKSYGFNAAQLAGIPDEIIRKACYKAKELEKSVLLRKLFRLLFSCKDFSDVQRLKNEIEKYNCS